MFSQSTRLELTIVGAAFLVLLLCRQPPRSGNAGVVRDAGPALQQPVPEARDREQKIQDGTIAPVPSAPGGPPAHERSNPPARARSDAPTSDNTSPDMAVLPQPKRKPMAVVESDVRVQG